MCVLLVEDEPLIGGAFQRQLGKQNVAVDWVSDGPAAELSLRSNVYQVLVLDLAMPHQEGQSILTLARRRRRDAPVIILTARDVLPGRIIGAASTAEPYLARPFDLNELIARVRHVLRSYTATKPSMLRCGPLTLDPEAGAVTLNGASVDLSPREFSILEALMQQPGIALSRKALLTAAYRWYEEVGSNAIDVLLDRLRRKLGADLISDERGTGYRISRGSP